MGLFGNNKKEEKSDDEKPKLPKLPDAPEEDSSESDLPKLPKYPSTGLGDKMSQSSIKEAVSGEKEDEDEDADEFVREQMTPEPQSLEHDEETLPESDSRRRTGREESISRTKKVTPSQEGTREKTEQKKPVYIRIDKFEGSLETFKAAKDKISEMESLLSEIKETKEKEENELSKWEGEVQALKDQIGRIEDDVFSKV